jgi:hypothetical protein
MPTDSIREKVLQRLQNQLAAIQSGIIVEPSNALPEPAFITLDNFNTQDDIDEWTPSPQALTPELYTGPVSPFTLPGCLSFIKEAGGPTGTISKTFATTSDATRKVGSVYLYVPNTSVLANNECLTVIFAEDDFNYFYQLFDVADFIEGNWTQFTVNIDGNDCCPAALIVGNPDKSKINGAAIIIKTNTGATTLGTGDVLIDFMILNDVDHWVPSGGASPPALVFDNNTVVGTYSIGFGHVANADVNFGVIKTLQIGIDATGGDVEAWVYIKDKTIYNSVPPLGASLVVVVGNDSSNWYAKFYFHDDIRDVVNDLTNGWNRFLFDPVTEADLVVGSPDITDLQWFNISGFLIDEATFVPTGDIRVDFVRVIGPDGLYNNDIKKVYRYAIASQQTTGTPILTFAVLKEAQSTAIYPVISSELVISIDAEVELPFEAVLDQELGQLADDIQVAIGQEQDLWGMVRYMKITNLEFHVREGTHTGILVVVMEIGFAYNQLDPTTQGV